MEIKTKDVLDCAIPSNLFLCDLTKEERMSKITVLSKQVEELRYLLFECKDFVLEARDKAKNDDRKYYLNDLVRRINSAMFKNKEMKK